MPEMVFSPFGGPFSPEKLMAAREDGGYGLGDDAMTMRALCVRDPLYLASEVLGKTLLRNPAPQHRRVADLILAQKSFLYLDHRGSWKTTLADETATIHDWLRFPDYRVLFLQANMDLAKKLSGQVRGHLRENAIFRAVYPEYAINTADEHGQIMSFSVPCKRSITREASLTIGTPETSLSMMHFDVIRGSDISNETNNPPPCGKGTIEEAMKIRGWLATTDGLLESRVVNPFAHKTFDGTRWSSVDAWAYLIENDVNNRLEKIIHGIEMRDGLFYSSVPGFTHEVIKEIREQPTMSAAMFAANYLNDPMIGAEAMQFQEGWFHPYEKEPEVMSVGITVDPAWTEQEKNPDADRSAVVVSGITPDGNLYVLAYRAGRWAPSELLEIIYSLTATWKPDWGVGIEGGTQSVALIETFRNELARGFPFVPYREISPRGKNKLVRVIPLHTHAQRHGIYVKPGEHSELVQEFLKFPGGRYKDLVDALAYRAADLQLGSIRNVIPTNKPNNPRNLMTGQDVLDIITKTGRVKNRMPWETVLEHRN